MKLAEYEIENIRDVLQNLNPNSSSIAAKPLPVDQIYTPETHKSALDIERPLVVGNRGTGKSVWSGALADKNTRTAIAKQYNYELLNSTEVTLGFHESAGKIEGIAPSAKTLSSLLKDGKDPETIWTAVLLLAVSKIAKIRINTNLTALIDWIDNNPEKCEEKLRTADKFFTEQGKKFLLVFDALDRLGSNWHEIRPLTNGVLRLTLSMQGFESMRSKVFMRTDQFKDNETFSFPDASKIKAARVELAWHSTELYGLLFKYLTNNNKSKTAIDKIHKGITGKSIRAYTNISTPEVQKPIFNIIAGEYMGADPRRGRTYTWIIDHLADAFHETTPRSFLVTLQRAASARQKPTETVIDHNGIREGVQSASGIRVDQLLEDYTWIAHALNDLEGLEVPCSPSSFIKRWQEKRTIQNIADLTRSSERAGPVELEKSESRKEELLLESLTNIGVVEFRSESKINMPDIFRVAAKIKRRGGVKPPSSSRIK
ncbi:MAG: hypothetical protein ACI9EB_000146 [Pseudomonas sp.]|jgi:hypothetical protein